MDTELVKEEAKRTTEPLTNGFIPNLKGKKNHYPPDLWRPACHRDRRKIQSLRDPPPDGKGETAGLQACHCHY